MRTFFGSGDPRVIAELDAQLDRAAQQEDDPEGMFNPDFCAEFRMALRQVVEAGVPVPGLKAEGPHHALVADWLAQYQPRHTLTDCDYKYLALLDFFEEHGKLLTPTGRKLFGYLVEGRPLFGEGFRSTPLYGYLTFEEAAVLRSCLEGLKGREWDDEEIEELVADFSQYLDEIRSEGLDVWAFVG
jgi:hypothetical protein